MNIIENLPLPVVHYPPHYGIFIGFSQSQSDPIYFCKCALPAIENYFNNNESIRSNHFPIQMLENGGFVHLRRLVFKESICHRCNVSTPSITFCHEMYGSQFKQYHGWYINQTYLKFGIRDYLGPFNNINDYSCPPDLLELIHEFSSNLKARDGFMKDNIQFSELNNLRKDISIDPKAEQEYFEKKRAYEKLIVKLKRKIENYIEDECRTEFGYKKIGEGWISENQLFKIVKRIYPNNLIQRHFRPSWLNNLELDIFLPELNLGFEYQGQQHFFPIKAWGGKKSYQELKNRDKLKKDLCQLNKIKLVEILFTEPLTEDYVKIKIEITA